MRRIVSGCRHWGIHRVDFSTCSAGATGKDPRPRRSHSRFYRTALAHILLVGDAARFSSWQIAHPVAVSRGVAWSLMRLRSPLAHSRPTENVLRVLGCAGSATADLFHGFAVRHEALSRADEDAQPPSSRERPSATRRSTWRDVHCAVSWPIRYASSCDSSVRRHEGATCSGFAPGITDGAARAIESPYCARARSGFEASRPASGVRCVLRESPRAAWPNIRCRTRHTAASANRPTVRCTPGPANGPEMGESNP